MKQHKAVQQRKQLLRAFNFVQESVPQGDASHDETSTCHKHLNQEYIGKGYVNFICDEGEVVPQEADIIGPPRY
jgi:hypothetical protein